MNLAHEIEFEKIHSGAVSGSTTQYTNAVDLLGCAGVMLTTVIPTPYGESVFLKGQASDDVNFVTGVRDIDGAKVIPMGTANVLVVLDISGVLERYVRGVLVRAGSANQAVNPIYAGKYGVASQPAINGTDAVTATVAMPDMIDPVVGIIRRPVVEAPLQDADDVELDSLLEGSTYAIIDSTDTHSKSQWQIAPIVNGEPDWNNCDLDVTVTEGTLDEYQLVGDELTAEKDYAIRVRYGGDEVGWSDWSAVVTFNTLSALTIESITPDEGPNTGATEVTITGTGFMEDATVEFDGTPATEVAVVDGNTITCVAPAGSTGQVDVVVENPDGGKVTEANGFTYISVPTLTTVAPDNGEEAGGTSATLTGTEFADGATVLFGATPATSVVVVGPTSITCATPAGTGLVSVTVENADGGTAVKEDAFTYTE